MKAMAAAYGFDISKPAANAKEACQWLYFGYLAAIKTQNGAAMSVGRISTFLDIYMERDLARGLITEEQAQELIDHMVMKFRMVKFARIPSYNALFSGDPVWATLEVGGIGVDGRSMVTKNDYPLPAHAGKHGSVAGTEHDRALFRRICRTRSSITLRRSPC